MRTKLALYLGVLGLFCQGCSPLAEVARTVVVEPVEYPEHLEGTAEKHRNKKLAEAAWDEYLVDHPEAFTSRDRHDGFVEGYADYLFAGGTGNPPPVPPRCYWRTGYETAEGHDAILAWFAGFREGAECARQSGYRELVTLPSSARSLAPAGPGSPPWLPYPAAPSAPPHHDELLSHPRPVSPGPAPGTEVKPPSPRVPQTTPKGPEGER